MIWNVCAEVRRRGDGIQDKANNMKCLNCFSTSLTCQTSLTLNRASGPVDTIGVRQFDLRPYLQPSAHLACCWPAYQVHTGTRPHYLHSALYRAHAYLQTFSKQTEYHILLISCNIEWSKGINVFHCLFYTMQLSILLDVINNYQVIRHQVSNKVEYKIQYLPLKCSEILEWNTI